VDRSGAAGYIIVGHVESRVIHVGRFSQPGTFDRSQCLAHHVVIIGNGVAGFSAARRLRREDRDLTISIFSDEAHPFYLRGRLKDFICGAVGQYETMLESRNLYRREGLSLFLQTPVVALDTGHNEILQAGGERVRYDRLLLAMGCRPAALPMPGGRLEGVFSLRTLADAEAIRRWMLPRRRAVILGEGIVSMQLAESLVRLGRDVEYMLMGEHFWPEVLNPTASRIVEQLMLDHGVRLHKRVTGQQILETDGRASAIRLDGGRQVPCDMVGHGCGFRPSVRLLEGTPVACRQGILVNDQLQTSVAGVFAAGDCIGLGSDKAPGLQCYGRWQDSFTQGETAAVNMLGGREHVPSFGMVIKTEIFGLGVAALGQSNMPEEDPTVQTVQAVRGTTYRRLVFKDDILIGAILMGDLDHAEILREHIRNGAMRNDLAEGLIPALIEDRERLEEPLAARCPICTDQLILPGGALIGSRFECNSCGTQLRLTYSQGLPSVVPDEPQ